MMIANGIRALVVFMLMFATQTFGAPTLIDNVHGYTLAHDQLITFDAMLFNDGKVVSTGRAAALRKRFPRAAIIDGHGKTLLPGMIDAHGHVYGLGTTTTDIVLDDTESLQEALETIRVYANENPDRTWLRGAGWNQVKWKLGRFPTAAELDAVVSDRPVALWRVDGHAEWLNSKALRAAGITHASTDPAGGRIERDAQGNPSGVLVDKATEIVDAKLPDPTPAERRSQVTAALLQMNSVGLTSVGDAGNSATDIALYRELADQGLLSVRIYAMILDTGDDFKLLSKTGPLIGYGDDRLTVRAVKLISDGALGSRGAALLAPYSDQPTQSGLLQMSNAVIEDKIQTALKAGYQVNIHAIGDAANRQVLDGFEAAYKVVGGRQLRNRIEHAQVIALADIPRLKQLDLIASMQPTHATSDMNMAEERIGKERLKGAYAWRTLLDQGTRIAGGSDFPVESANPFFGLHAAVTRTDHAGNPRGGWHAEQAMTLLEAFRAFTLDAAYAQHQENTIGSLEPGKWADFILIDRDLFKIAAAQIWQIKVHQTWVAGKNVYTLPQTQPTRPTE
jgi:predicted amidohydrolase YtcJ